jgi:hypothetical protein
MEKPINQFLVVIGTSGNLNASSVTLAVDSIAGETAEESAKSLLIKIANIYNKTYDQDVRYNDIIIKSICRLN